MITKSLQIFDNDGDELAVEFYVADGKVVIEGIVELGREYIEQLVDFLYDCAESIADDDTDFD